MVVKQKLEATVTKVTKLELGTAVTRVVSSSAWQNIRPQISLDELLPLQADSSDGAIPAFISYYTEHEKEFNKVNNNTLVNKFYYDLSKIPGDRVYRMFMDVLGVNLEDKDFIIQMYKRMSNYYYGNYARGLNFEEV